MKPNGKSGTKSRKFTQSPHKHILINLSYHSDIIMKKLIVLALILAPALSIAQTATVNVTTTIRDAFALTKVDDLVYGNVEAGDAVSVLATTNVATNAGSTAKRAVITSTATTATVYTVSGLSISGQTATPTILLPYVSGGGTTPAANITVTLNFAVNSASPTAYTLNTTTGATLATGNTLYIGGSFTAPTGDSIGGLYSGALTVSAIYL